MSNVRSVDEANFKTEVLDSSKPVLVDFWAEWCGPCHHVGLVLDAILVEHAEKLDVVKLNVDKNPNLSAEYRITSIPTIKVFVDGQVVKTIIGAYPRPILEQELAEFLT